MINCQQKGYRKETQIREKLHAKGFITYRPMITKYGQQDVFKLFDVIAYHPVTHELKFISVKSSYAGTKHRKDLSKFKVSKVSIELEEFKNKSLETK